MIYRLATAVLVSLFVALPTHASATLEIAQLQACRAVSSFLIYRFEGFQPAHAERLDGDLAALASTLALAAQQDDDLHQRQATLTALLRQGAGFGRTEDDMPWNYPTQLSRALRDFLTRAQALGDQPSASPALESEYLAVQYLYRAYTGLFELAQEQQQLYLGQDERRLVPAIDAQLDALPAAQASTLKPRWRFLRAAFNDMNSQSGAISTVSHRPFAPLIVDRNTRLFSEQYLQLN